MTFSISFATLTNVATLMFGVCVGISFSILFVVGPRKETKVKLPSKLHDPNYEYDLSEPLLLNVGNEDQEEENDEARILENSTLADRLYDEVKILCSVFTDPKNHKKKATHVLDTWGRRCNKLLFMSTTKDLEIDSIALPVVEHNDHKWGKTKESFKYIYENHLNEYDWFLKVTDDTYVIVENLRFMLYPYAAETPIYFGCKFKHFVEQGYMSGDAGYVLSREAVRRFVEVGIPDKEKCRQGDFGFEDVEMGICLDKLHVVAGDSRDAASKGRFFPFPPEKHLIPNNTDSWYSKYIYYETDEGPGCCSDNTISFHEISPNQMHVVDYFIYHLRPYGIVRHAQPLPDKLSRNISVESSETQNKN